MRRIYYKANKSLLIKLSIRSIEIYMKVFIDYCWKKKISIYCSIWDE